VKLATGIIPVRRCAGRVRYNLDSSLVARSPRPSLTFGASANSTEQFSDAQTLRSRGGIPLKAKKTWRKMRRHGQSAKSAQLRPIGVIRSSIKKRSEAPKQGSEGAPDAWLELSPLVAQGLDGLVVGDNIIVVTWLHQARRDVLKVHPRSDPRRPLTGVFTTRSPDRPNPLGLHPVTVREVAKNRLRIGPIEVIDGTPVVDIKPVYC